MSGNSKFLTISSVFFPEPGCDAATLEKRENRFFNQINISGTLYKTTYYHRLDDLNVVVDGCLPKNHELHIMDVAVSSGVTTGEWVQHLESSGLKFHMTGGDIAMDVYMISLANIMNVLIGRYGKVFQFDLFGWPLPNSPMRIRGKIFKALSILLNFLIRAKLIKNRRKQSGEREFLSNILFRVTPLKLISNKVRNVQNLVLIEDDIQNDNPDHHYKFDVIRAANILNKKFFDDEVLRKMVNNLRKKLKPGGILIICRTLAEENHATIFKLTDENHFQAIETLGQGSEITDLVVS